MDQANLADALKLDRSIAAAAVRPTQRQMLGMIIEYIGPSASCLITTATNNSIASAVGVAGAEAADANFTIGATSGTINLTNAAADTMGELVDFINGLADYKARLVCLRRADDSDVAGALFAVTSQQAKVPGVGLGLAVDTAVCLHVSCEISAYDGRIYSGTSKATPRRDSDAGRVAINSCVRISSTLTYTGADAFKVYEVDDVNKTEELLYTGLLSGVTGASTVAGATTFPGNGIVGRPGRKLIVRSQAATTMSAITAYVCQATTKLLV